MTMILILIVLFILFIGFCTLVGLGVLLSGNRGRSAGILSAAAGGTGLLVFLLVMAMLFVSGRSPDYAEEPRAELHREVKIAASSDRGHHGTDQADGSYELSPPGEVKPVEVANSMTETETPPVKPDWVGRGPLREGQIYQTTVVSDPKLTKEECIKSLGEPILEKAEEYLDQLLGSGASKTIGLEEAEIREDVCKAEHIQKHLSKTVGVGEMKILHVLMEFDEPFRNKMRLRYREAVVQQRMILAGGGAFSVLIILGSIFGYLQIDTATKGFYTRRLQLATAAVILTVLLLGMRLA